MLVSGTWLSCKLAYVHYSKNHFISVKKQHPWPIFSSSSPFKYICTDIDFCRSLHWVGKLERELKYRKIPFELEMRWWWLQALWNVNLCLCVAVWQRCLHCKCFAYGNYRFCLCSKSSLSLSVFFKRIYCRFHLEKFRIFRVIFS